MVLEYIALSVALSGGFLYVKVKIWISGRALLLRSSLSALGNFLPPERWYMVVQDLFLKGV